jgi:hypothetical protein
MNGGICARSSTYDEYALLYKVKFEATEKLSWAFCLRIIANGAVKI